LAQSRDQRRWLMIGACVGLAIGIVAGQLAAPSILEGSLVRWKSIGHPEGVISRILAADSQGLYVEMADGLVYQGFLLDCRNRLEPCWKHSTSDTLNRDPHSKIGAMCSSNFQQMRMPPLPMIQCASSYGIIGVEFYQEAHYALLEDGNIWVWQHSSGRMSLETLVSYSLRCPVIPCSGALLGLAVALGLHRLSSVRTITPNREPSAD
jgi:hypothetical protein